MSFRPKSKKCRSGKKVEQEEAAGAAAGEEGKKGKAPPCLKVILKHGDVLIMEVRCSSCSSFRFAD